MLIESIKLENFRQFQNESITFADGSDGKNVTIILGENGSGKTTLMNMLAGIYFPDEGEILVGGNPVTIASPKDAFDCGIGMILILSEKDGADCEAFLRSRGESVFSIGRIVDGERTVSIKGGLFHGA